MTVLLEARNLRVAFGDFCAVDGVDLTVEAGEVLGIVGESGSGKSVAMLALLGLVDAPGKVSADAIRFDGRDLLHISARERRSIVGREIAIVFQDALASLDPAYTVGFQIGEVLTTHLGLRGDERQRRIVELLEAIQGTTVDVILAGRRRARTGRARSPTPPATGRCSGSATPRPGR